MEDRDFSFTTSKRGAKQIVFDGYIFNNEDKTKNKYWSCTHKQVKGIGCRARLRCQVANDLSVVSVTLMGDHRGHLPDPALVREKDIRGVIRQRAQQDSTVPTSRIIRDMEIDIGADHATVQQLQQVAKRARRAKVPLAVHNSNNNNIHISSAPTQQDVEITDRQFSVVRMSATDATFKQFKRLQNGSDIRGIALPGIPNENVNLTPLSAYFIGCAFVEWLKEVTGKQNAADIKVSFGRDPRLSGPALRSSVIAGLASKGVQVTDFGLCTTPAMFYSCVLEDYSFDGAIMMTASHLPFNRNGLKFFTKQGGLEKGNISSILQTAASECDQSGLKLGDAIDDPAFVLEKALDVDPNEIKYTPFIDAYAVVLQDIIKKGINHPQNYEKPLSGYKIIVDAGNGSGGFFTDKVLQVLGADTTGSQFLDPDGKFPNHVPNPEDKAAMEATIQAVKNAKADLGIVFDTDVDRSGIVDERGTEINRNRFIALMSSVVLREHPGTTIVTDSVTSNGLTQFIESQGGKQFRYRKGYKNIIAKGVELNDEGQQCELMMETSGHGAMKENYFLDDGAYLAVKAVIEMIRRKLTGEGSLTEVLDQLKEPVEAQEFRLNIKVNDFKPVSDEVLKKFPEWIPQNASDWQIIEPNYEGIRVNIPEDGADKKGWVLLRASLHDPLLVANAESDVKGGVAKSMAKLKQFFEQYQFPVDLSPIS